MKKVILALVMMCGSLFSAEYVRLELINNNGVVDYSVPAGKMLTRVHTTSGFIGYDEGRESSGNFPYISVNYSIQSHNQDTNIILSTGSNVQTTNTNNFMNNLKNYGYSTWRISGKAGPVEIYGPAIVRLRMGYADDPPSAGQYDAGVVVNEDSNYPDHPMVTYRLDDTESATSLSESLLAMRYLQVGDQTFTVSNGTAQIQMYVDESADLNTWSNTQHVLQLEVPADTDTKFFRFRMD